MNDKPEHKLFDGIELLKEKVVFDIDGKKYIVGHETAALLAALDKMYGFLKSDIETLTYYASDGDYTI